MSVSLRGNLEDFGIGEIFQLIGQQRKTGILEFSSKRVQIRIRFDRGAVVSAAPVGPRPSRRWVTCSCAAVTSPAPRWTNF